AARMHVAAVPLVRQRLVRVLRGTAALLRLGEQRLVVLLRRLERIGAHDRLARIVAVAVAPRGRARRLVADHALARGPLVLDRGRRIAAEVALVGPERAVLVKVLGRVEVGLQRLDARRVIAVAGAADERGRRRLRTGSSGRSTAPGRSTAAASRS